MIIQESCCSSVETIKSVLVGAPRTEELDMGGGGFLMPGS